MSQRPPPPPDAHLTGLAAANDASSGDGAHEVLPLDGHLSPLERQIKALQIEHRDLDFLIDQVLQQSAQGAPRDDLQLVRLKKRKLKLKDTIMLLQLQLHPDDRA